MRSSIAEYDYELPLGDAAAAGKFFENDEDFFRAATSCMVKSGQNAAVSHVLRKMPHW
jgi:hypothetical protein